MTQQPTASQGRAGRNLPLATGVGLSLAALVLVSIYTVTWLFVAVVAVAIGVGCIEIAKAMRGQQLRIPLVPVVAGTAVMVVAAYVDGLDALAAAYALTVLVVGLARLVGPADGLWRDTSASVFVVSYLPLLASFATWMVAQADGPDRIVVFVLAVVMSDVGGYAVGVVAGKHRMAPRVSPKKSWEGFGGSLLFSAVATAFSVPLLLDGDWWQGLGIGLVAVLTATLGDLAESLLKRDLGVKDMGRILPGHGGIMDRLDSLLPTAPVVALLLTAAVG